MTRVLSVSTAPHLRLSEQLQMHLVSLHRFRELKIEPGDVQSNWMHFFTGAYTDPKRVKELMKMTKELRGLEETYHQMIQDPKVWRQYQYEQLLIEDYLARVHEFHEEGKAEGEIKGRAEGKIEVARELLAEGETAERVARITKLPLDDVMALQKKLS